MLINQKIVINQKKSAVEEFILWNQYYSKNSIEKLMLENKFNIIDINDNLIANENSMFITAKKYSLK